MWTDPWDEGVPDGPGTVLSGGDVDMLWILFSGVFVGDDVEFTFEEGE